MNTSSHKSPAAHPSDREIVSVRVFTAPREAVFEAFGDPQQLAQWWGPKDFTDTIHEFDFRPGGTWKHTMHGPGGANYPNESIFREIVKPERIVFEHLEPVHHFQMTMIFAEQDGKTQLTWRMRFESAAEVSKLGDFIAGANEQNFDRLAAHLAKISAGKKS